ncbi:hypothetical protein M5K25_027664 [Dendrobium thyrsiflorum]|uniref:Uncharacterized protein n=1 Tax=Dendrobium thyrsiflorum TaxID=117978 RepID=A0ABD0TUC9_DENTH
MKKNVKGTVGVENWEMISGSRIVLCTKLVRHSKAGSIERPQPKKLSAHDAGQVREFAPGTRTAGCRASPNMLPELTIFLPQVQVYNIPLRHLRGRSNNLLCTPHIHRSTIAVFATGISLEVP